MKGIQGIILAAVFGGIGAVCNWFYVYRQAQEYDTVSFVKVAEPVNRGDRFKEEQLEELKVPRNNLGNLQDVAILWRDRTDIIGQIATRTYTGSEIVLREAATRPGVKDFAELLNADDVAFSIPVDAKTFVAERANPGNMVSFVVPDFAPRTPNPQNNNNGNNPENEPAVTVGQTRIFGPFKILALGSRLGNKEVDVSAGRSSGSEHVITIGVPYKTGPNGEKRLDPEVDQMLNLIRLNGNRNVQVMIHSSHAVKAPGLPLKGPTP